LESRRDDEREAALLEAIRIANSDGTYPVLADLCAVLMARGLSASDVAAAADRLYRCERISVNADGGMAARY
jgi:hypothetical protein